MSTGKPPDGGNNHVLFHHYEHWPDLNYSLAGEGLSSHSQNETRPQLVIVMLVVSYLLEQPQKGESKIRSLSARGLSMVTCMFIHKISLWVTFWYDFKTQPDRLICFLLHRS